LSPPTRTRRFSSRSRSASKSLFRMYSLNHLSQTVC
jgi:hypothetical protein